MNKKDEEFFKEVDKTLKEMDEQIKELKLINKKMEKILNEN